MTRRKDTFRQNAQQAVENMAHERTKRYFNNLGVAAINSVPELEEFFRKIPDWVLRDIGAGIEGGLEVSDTTVPNPYLRGLIHAAVGAVGGLTEGIADATGANPAEVKPTEVRSKLLDFIKQKATDPANPARPSTPSVPPPPPFESTLSPQQTRVLRRLRRKIKPTSDVFLLLEKAAENDNWRLIRYPLLDLLNEIFEETGTGEPLEERHEEFSLLLDQGLRPSLADEGEALAKDAKKIARKVVGSIARSSQNRTGNSGDDAPSLLVENAKTAVLITGVAALGIFQAWYICLGIGLGALVIGGFVVGNLFSASLGTFLLFAAMIAGQVIPGFAGGLDGAIKWLLEQFKLSSASLPSFEWLKNLLLDGVSLVTFAGLVCVVTIVLGGSDYGMGRLAVAFAVALLVCTSLTLDRIGKKELIEKARESRASLFVWIAGALLVGTVLLSSLGTVSWQPMTQGTKTVGDQTVAVVCLDNLCSKSHPLSETFRNVSDVQPYNGGVLHTTTKGLQANLPGFATQTVKVGRKGLNRLEIKPEPAMALSHSFLGRLIGADEWYDKSVGGKVEVAAEEPAGLPKTWYGRTPIIWVLLMAVGAAVGFGLAMGSKNKVVQGISGWAAAFCVIWLAVVVIHSGYRHFRPEPIPTTPSAHTTQVVTPAVAAPVSATSSARVAKPAPRVVKVTPAKEKADPCAVLTSTYSRQKAGCK